MTPPKKLTPDKELEVALKIYEVTRLRKEKLWFTKLLQELAPKYNRISLAHALTFLEDTLMVYYELGETEEGRCGFLMTIWDHYEPKLDELYRLVYPERCE